MGRKSSSPKYDIGVELKCKSELGFYLECRTPELCNDD
jgi:hypothetical protein